MKKISSHVDLDGEDLGPTSDAISLVGWDLAPNASLLSEARVFVSNCGAL